MTHASFPNAGPRQPIPFRSLPPGYWKVAAAAATINSLPITPLGAAEFGMTGPAKAEVEANTNKTTEASTLNSKTLPPDTFFKANNVWSIDNQKTWANSSPTASSAYFFKEDKFYSVNLESGATQQFDFQLPKEEGVRLVDPSCYVSKENIAVVYAYGQREKDKKYFFSVSFGELGSKKAVKSFKFSPKTLNLGQEEVLDRPGLKPASFYSSKDEKTIYLHTAGGILTIDTIGLKAKPLAQFPTSYYICDKRAIVSDDGHLFLLSSRGVLRVSPDGTKTNVVDPVRGKDLRALEYLTHGNNFVFVSREGNLNSKSLRLSCLSAKDLNLVWTTNIDAEGVHDFIASEQVLYLKSNYEKPNPKLFAIDITSGKTIWSKIDKNPFFEAQYLAVFSLGKRDVRVTKIGERLCLEDLTTSDGVKINIMRYPQYELRPGEQRPYNFNLIRGFAGGGAVVQLGDPTHDSKIVAVFPKKPGVKKLSAQAKDGISVTDVSALK